MSPFPRSTFAALLIFISLHSLSLLLSASLAAAEQPARKEADDFTGTYVMDSGNKAGGTLKVLHLPENRLKFELECNRGAPSYNSGEASGILEVKNAAAVYRTTEFGGACELRFEFQKKGVTVSQKGSDADCGFGFGVRCDGSYRLKSRTPPKLSEE